MVDFEERWERIKQALTNLVEKAEEDGIITEEEARILETAKQAGDNYEQIIQEALEDGIIDEEEQEVLIKLEEDMYSDTYFTAMEDAKLDEDELLLLATLIRTIDPRASISWMDEDRENSD